MTMTERSWEMPGHGPLREYSTNTTLGSSIVSCIAINSYNQIGNIRWGWEEAKAIVDFIDLTKNEF